MSLYTQYSKKIIRRVLNIPGFHTKRKIVVIESDDWGSIRMPSSETYHTLKSEGHRVENLSFNRYDSLASEKDLSELFNVLLSVKDKHGNPAKITANTIVANPDFKKIKASEYKSYFYEPFTDTLKRYSEHANAFNLWKEGIGAGVFQPQFHGREHLNVPRWMHALQNNLGKVRRAFDLEMYDLSEGAEVSENTFVDALNFSSETELEFQKQSLTEGLDLFETLFGFRSKTIIAPCYIWSNKLNHTLHLAGVKAFQGGWYQMEPMANAGHKMNRRFHFTGQKNKYNQLYMVRDVHFEPSIDADVDGISDAIERIELSFKNHKPAIISSHRINFIGFLNSENRDRNLIQFQKLLKEVVKRWPDVEFMSSDQLVDVMC